MKKNIAFAVLILISAMTFAQQEYFIKSYGGSLEDYFSDVAAMPNGGYMAVGSSKSFGDPDSFDGYIVTTDTEGNQTKSMGVWGAGDDEAAFVRVSPDSSFYVCFNSQISTGVSRTQLLCIDDTIGWKWTSPVYNTTNAYYIDGCFLPDGTFVVIGRIVEDSISVALWFDQNGDTIKSKVLSTNDSIHYRGVKYRNGIIIVDGDNNFSTVFIEKFDTNGNLISHYEKYLNLGYSYGVLNDNNILYGVETMSAYRIPYSAADVEHDSTLWQGILGTDSLPLLAYSFSLFNNDLLICGRASFTDTVSGYLVKIDEWSGVPLWERYYKPYHSKLTKLFNVKQCDNKILCVGTTATGIPNGMDALLIVADENGWAGISEQEKAPVALEVYPNPVKDILHISQDEGNAWEYSIYDLYGRLVRSGVVDNNQVSTRSLPKGLYIIKLMQDGKFRTAKFVKE